MIKNKLLETNQFEQGDFAIDFVQYPLGINMTGTYPVNNSNPWFLKVSADRIDPEPTGAAAYAIDISNHTVSKTPDIFADTLYPVGNESVFLPKIEFFQPSREKINSRSQEWIEYAPISALQKTLVYADYTASPTERLEIHSSISEQNSWVQPATLNVNNEPIDGGGNDYTDSYSGTWYGESHGWHVVTGELNGFNAVYPDLNHPSWQKSLNRISSNTL